MFRKSVSTKSVDHLMQPVESFLPLLSWIRKLRKVLFTAEEQSDFVEGKKLKSSEIELTTRRFNHSRRHLILNRIRRQSSRSERAIERGIVASVRHHRKRKRTRRRPASTAALAAGELGGLGAGGFGPSGSGRGGGSLGAAFARTSQGTG
jgi:hypothetical protein